MSNKETFILGAGMTGLAAGMVSGLKVYEAQEVPGGICSSYYLKANQILSLLCNINLRMNKLYNAKVSV